MRPFQRAARGTVALAHCPQRSRICIFGVERGHGGQVGLDTPLDGKLAPRKSRCGIADAPLCDDARHGRHRFEPRGGNLYAESASSGAPQAGAPGTAGLGSLLQGMVEGSNVNVVEELVSMIATQRAYELNSKAITTSDQMLQRLSQL